VDPQIQQVVGQISAQAYAATAVTQRAAQAAQAAYEAHFAGDEALEKHANIAAEIESAQGQLVVSELALRASSDLFNALGASSASAARRWTATGATPAPSRPTTRWSTRPASSATGPSTAPSRPMSGRSAPAPRRRPPPNPSHPIRLSAP
jgi:alkylation response protein AidB-like acyl-CoA dehydrogenase